VSDEAFADALRELREIVGQEWVISDAEALARYDDPYPVGEDVAAGPAADVCPDTVEQVQAIVRVANKQVPARACMCRGRAGLCDRRDEPS